MFILFYFGLFFKGGFGFGLFDAFEFRPDKLVPSTIEMNILPEVKSSLETSESIRTANL